MSDAPLPHDPDEPDDASRAPESSDGEDERTGPAEPAPGDAAGGEESDVYLADGDLDDDDDDDDEDDEDDDSDADAAAAGDDAEDAPQKVVFVSTAVPIAISVAAIDDERAPAGTALGSFIGERLVARCAMPLEAIERLMELALFDEPVPLALLAVEEEPGLQCRLFALVPAERISDAEHADEPWKASVPSFEELHGDDDDDDDDLVLSGEGEGGDDDDDDETTIASILLGHIVRFDRDRKFADDLTAEAVDVLQKIVLGGELKDANARAVDDLLDSL